MERVSVSFQDVSFHWEGDPPLFEHVYLTLPEGMISLLGPNGSGKTTFLFLATGRVLPNQGRILLWGQDTAQLDEGARNKLASVLYQNMEFDHDEPLGELLDQVQEAGSFKDEELKRTLIQEFKLEKLLTRPSSRLAKGEMQRAVLAFCLLYGSKLMALDEPVFALEEKDKDYCLSFVRDFSLSHQITILASLHELELSQKFFDFLLLIEPNQPPTLGPTQELFKKEILEKLFRAPWELLKKRENFYRDGLLALYSRK